MRAAAYPSETPNTVFAPEDLMSAYVALMTDEAAGIKGQVIDLQPQ